MILKIKTWQTESVQHIINIIDLTQEIWKIKFER